nr:basic proline-rich protein-like [Aegilops tauschii subsp. strangulata]
MASASSSFPRRPAPDPARSGRRRSPPPRIRLPAPSSSAPASSPARSAATSPVHCCHVLPGLSDRVPAARARPPARPPPAGDRPATFTRAGPPSPCQPSRAAARCQPLPHRTPPPPASASTAAAPRRWLRPDPGRRRPDPAPPPRLRPSLVLSGAVSGEPPPVSVRAPEP